MLDMKVSNTFLSENETLLNDRLGPNLLVRILLVIKLSQAAFRNYGWRF